MVVNAQPRSSELGAGAGSLANKNSCFWHGRGFCPRPLVLCGFARCAVNHLCCSCARCQLHLFVLFVYDCMRFMFLFVFCIGLATTIVLYF